MRTKIGKINKIFAFILAVALLICCASVLCSCSKTTPTVKKGIEIENQTKVEYSSSTKSYTYNVINGFLTEYAKLSSVGGSVPNATKDKIDTITADIQKVIESVGVSEKAYNSTFELINENLQNYALATFQLANGNLEKENANKLKGLYTAISATFGARQTSGVIYEIINYYYSHEYNEKIADIERYEERFPDLIPHLKADAEELKENKRILTEEIGKENFIPVTEMAYFTLELFFGGAFENSMLSSFTTTEIMQFIKFPEFSSISVNSAGWEFLLKLAKPVFEENTLNAKVFDKMLKNGDINVIANKMGSVVEIFSFLQNGVNLEGAELIKQGKITEFMGNAFERLTNEQWGVVEGVLGVELKNDEYNALAKERYGEDYQTYLDGIPSHTIQEVKSAVGTVEFKAILQEYIKGVCPALFYGV